MARYEDLWQLAVELGENTAQRPALSVFCPCGFAYLTPPPLKGRDGYFCTPSNSRTFASTGGDGVHYGFLELDDALSEFVVMTVPMGYPHNTIVAETFDEFLGLGYHVGWFALEHWVCDAAVTMDLFNSPSKGDMPKCDALLAVLRDRLHIRHVPLSADRMADLHAKYAPLVNALDEVPDDW